MADPKKPNNSDLSPEEQRIAAEYQKQYEEEEAKRDNQREAGFDPDLEERQARIWRAEEEARRQREEAAAKDRQQRVDYVNKHTAPDRFPEWYRKVPVLGALLKPKVRTDDEKAAAAPRVADAELAKEVAHKALKNFYGEGFGRLAEKVGNPMAPRRPKAMVRGDENQEGLSEEQVETIRKAMKKASATTK